MEGLKAQSEIALKPRPTHLWVSIWTALNRDLEDSKSTFTCFLLLDCLITAAHEIYEQFRNAGETIWKDRQSLVS